jgi:hypothetical protein
MQSLLRRKGGTADNTARKEIKKNEGKMKSTQCV